MSTQGAAQGPGNARNTEGPDITSSHGEELKARMSASTTPGRSRAAARTLWDSTTRGGSQWFQSSLLP
jgi:hypothetical protein